MERGGLKQLRYRRALGMWQTYDDPTTHDFAQYCMVRVQAVLWHYLVTMIHDARSALLRWLTGAHRTAHGVGLWPGD